MVTKVDLKMLRSDSDGQIVSEQQGLVVRELSTDILDGVFDRNNGQLAINIPNVGKLVINGLPTINDIGYGPAGLPGRDGTSGINGLMGRDGQRGVDGCPGSRGSEGAQGKQGVIGFRGPPGPTGQTGATGATGAAGVLQVFVQSQDPSIDNDVLPGALWIRE